MPPTRNSPSPSPASRHSTRTSSTRWCKDAEAHAEDDRQRREQAEVRNNADSLVYQTEKTLKDSGDKLGAEDRAGVEEKLNELKTALEGEDIEKIKDATDALMSASQAFSQQLYEQAAQAAGDEQSAGEAPDDDEVVDAEIVDDES